MTAIHRADRIPVVFVQRVPPVRCPECGSTNTRSYATRGQSRYRRCKACKSPFKTVIVDKLPAAGIDSTKSLA